MVIILLVKIIKLSWHQYPQLQETIGDLTKFEQIGGERHLLISLTALEELIIEMGYITRGNGKNLHSHRRISVNFRDTQLFSILNLSIEYI